MEKKLILRVVSAIIKPEIPTTILIALASIIAILPTNSYIAYSQGTPTCEELEEISDEDKFECREYESEDGDRAVVACGDDNGDDFKCNKVIKDGFGDNTNPAARNECELISDGEKCKQVN